MPAAQTLTPMQSKFCAEYVRTQHVTNSALAAGCAPKSAASTGSKWLRMPKIKAEIAFLKRETQHQVLEEYKLDLRAILDEVAMIGMGGMADFIKIDGDGLPVLDLSTVPPHMLNMIAEFQTETVIEPGSGEDEPPTHIRKTRFKLYNKLDALEKLMKHFGGYAKDNAQRNPGTEWLARVMQKISEQGSMPVITHKEREG